MEMKTIATASLNVEAANWIAHTIQGCATPHISSRYVGDESGIVTGTESYITFRMDHADDILELMREYKIGVNYSNEMWRASSDHGMDSVEWEQAETISHAVLKMFARIHFGKLVSVPVSLQGK